MYNELAIEKKQPFTVLGFPCNQFGQQEPHENEDIKEFAKNSYGVRFPLFAKIKVADLSAHPAYRYLKGENLVELSSLLLGSINE